MNFKDKFIKTGISEIDSVIDGLLPSELTTIGARPQVGKTTFLCELVNNLCIKDDKPVIFFSIQTDEELIKAKIISQMTKIPLKKILKGDLVESDEVLAKKAERRLSESKLRLITKPQIFIDDLYEIVKEFERDNPDVIVLIDYLNAISVSDDTKPIYEEMTEVVSKLKTLARELRIPVITAATVARSAENEEPTLYQLRGTGCIEDKSDIVIFLHKDYDKITYLVAKNNRGDISLWNSKSSNKISHNNYCPDNTRLFSNFITNSDYEFAYKVLQNAILDSKYNPIYLYGNSGVGKTHLLFAFCNKYKEAHPDAKIIYTSVNALVEEFTESLKDDSIDQFHARFCNADILVLDNFEYLSGRIATQQEIVYIIKEHYLSKYKLVIIGSNEPPKTISNFADELRSLVGGGLVIEMPEPTKETKEQLIHRKLSSANKIFNQDIIDYLVQESKTAAVLIGHLNKLISYSDLMGVDLSGLSSEQIKDLL